MHILIIDQCSGSKQCPGWFDAFDAETIDAHSLTELQARKQTPTYPAHDLYTGRQQQYINVAVDRLRESGDTVDRYYISAGFGFISECTELPPYEVTFQNYGTAGIHERSADLKIQANLLDRVDAESTYDLAFFALGNDYYESLDLPRVLDAIPESTMIALFNREDDTERRPNVVSIPARTTEAKEQGCTVVALKGHYLKQFAASRANGRAVESPPNIVEYCTTEQTHQSDLDAYD